jgi:asparagine synthase (glutamine-hydrolysing)
VALSGESADEVFGGYSWFHDPKTVNAATFPWLAAATTGCAFDGTQVLAPQGPGCRHRYERYRQFVHGLGNDLI